MWKGTWKKFKSEYDVFGWFPGLQNLEFFFEKCFVELVWKSFSNSLSYGLKESRESRALIIGFEVICIQKYKNFLPTIFLYGFELPLWMYELLWNTKFCFF